MGRCCDKTTYIILFTIFDIIFSLLMIGELILFLLIDNVYINDHFYFGIDKGVNIIILVIFAFYYILYFIIDKKKRKNIFIFKQCSFYMSFINICITLVGINRNSNSVIFIVPFVSSAFLLSSIILQSNSNKLNEELSFDENSPLNPNNYNTSTGEDKLYPSFTEDKSLNKHVDINSNEYIPPPSNTQE